MDWAEKYRPMHLADILGNGSAVRQIVDWAKTWTPDSRPLLFTGKPGIGKTSAALALARDMGWEVLELNASDARTKAIIERVAGNSSTTTSLFGAGRKLIIIDEVDNLEGNADRGGARAIADILKEAKQPIVLIANDAYGVSDSIRRLCDPVPFRAIGVSTLQKRMKEICRLEDIACGEDALSAIAESSAGDMRTAVNMLFGSSTGKTSISAGDINTVQKDERATIFDLVGGVFVGAPDRELQKLSFECDEKPDSVMQWIEESIPLLAGRCVSGKNDAAPVFHPLAVCHVDDDARRRFGECGRGFSDADHAPVPLETDEYRKKAENGQKNPRGIACGRLQHSGESDPEPVPGSAFPVCRKGSCSILRTPQPRCRPDDDHPA